MNSEQRTTNYCQLATKCEIRDTRYEIRIVIQNKPNFLDPQMNVSSVKTKYYENLPLRRRGENKPNQTQSPAPRFYPKNQHYPRKDMSKNLFFPNQDNFRSQFFVNLRKILELTAGCLSRKTQQRFEIVFYPAPMQDDMHNHHDDKNSSKPEMDIAPFVPCH